MQFQPAKNKDQEVYVTEGMCIGLFANPMPDGKSTRYVVSLKNPDPNGKPDKFSTFDANLVKGISKGEPCRIYFTINGQYKNLCYPPGAERIDQSDNNTEPIPPRQTKQWPKAANVEIPSVKGVIPSVIPYNSVTPPDEPEHKPVSDMVHCCHVNSCVALYSKWLEIAAQISPEALKELNAFECVSTVKEFVAELEK